MQRLPRTDLYRVNGHHALAESLRKLFDLEPRLRFQLLALVAGELKGRRLPVKEARIFGSAARGEMKPTSDVDLALVTSRENVAGVEAAAQEIAEKARERFGTRLNVLVGSPSLGRLSKSRQTRQGAWQAIEREGIDVFAAPHATG